MLSIPDNTTWFERQSIDALRGWVPGQSAARLIRQLATKYGAEILALEIMLDHVHRLGEVHPQWGIHR